MESLHLLILGVFAGIVWVYEGVVFVQMREPRFSFRLFFWLWYSVAYCFTPIGYAILREWYAVSAAPIFGAWLDQKAHWQYTACVIGGYGAYWLCSRIAKGQYSVSNAWSMVDERGVLRVAFLLVAAGVIGYLSFLYVYGTDALVVNIRYKGGDLAGNRLGSFFLYTRIWLFIGFLVLWTRWLVESATGRVRKWLGAAVIVSFILVAYTAIQGASRAYYANVVLLPMLCYAIVRNRLPNKWVMIGLSVIVVVTIVFGRTIFGVSALTDPLGASGRVYEEIKQTPGAVVLEHMVASFAHPYAGVYVAMEAAGGEIPYRWFYEVPLSVLFYLRILGVDVDYSITYYHTYVLTSMYNSNIPPGILAGGFYQGGVFGMIVWMAAYGWLSGYVDRRLRRLMDSDYRFLPFYLILGFMAGNFVMVGDPREPMITLGLIGMAFLVAWVDFACRKQKHLFRPRLARNPVGLRR